jgi:hypothetical protein
VLIHMSDVIADHCFELVSRHLAPGGAFYANVNLRPRRDESWQGFPVVYRDAMFYEGLARGHGLRIEPVGTLAELGHVSGDSTSDRQVMLKVTW